VPKAKETKKPARKTSVKKAPAKKPARKPRTASKPRTSTKVRLKKRVIPHYTQHENYIALPVTSPAKQPEGIIRRTLKLSLFILLGYCIAITAFYFKLSNDNIKNAASSAAQTNMALSKIGKGPDSLVPVSKISDVRQNELSLATATGKRIQIWTVDPTSGKGALKKTIALSDGLFDKSSLRSFGANNAIQFGPISDNIFIATGGRSSSDPKCLNRDGSCTWRILKLSRDSTDQQKLYESDDQPANWAVSKDNGKISIIYLNAISGRVVTLNPDSGQVENTWDFKRNSGSNFLGLDISSDGKVSYTAETVSSGHVDNQKLVLRYFDSAKNNSAEMKIMQASNISAETNLSPDGTKLAFLEGIVSPQHIDIFDISSKHSQTIPNDAELLNSNLFWSGKSDKLLYLTNDGPKYFVIGNSSAHDIPEIGKNISYVLGWADADDYFAYINEKGSLSLYDLAGSASKELKIGQWDSIEGWSWQ
jgi:hypothetical protein